MPKRTWSEIKHRAATFAKKFATTRSETAEAKSFWDAFFMVFGLERRQLASFEEPVRKLKQTWGRIDLLWPGVMLAEHKSAGQDLSRATTQAFEYIHGLIRDGRAHEAPQYVVVSDFRRVVLYDLEGPADDDGSGPQHKKLEFELKDLPRHVQAFSFMLGQRAASIRPEDPANREAYGLMARLHKALAASGYAGADLERFLVRVLFCLFAEDTGIFEPMSFTDLIGRSREDGSDLGPMLEKLFRVLDTPPTRRGAQLDEALAAFPYVNGGLFRDRLEMADFTAEMREGLLDAARFYWARISPAVFGSLFQGVLRPDERRKKGAHYTSEADILKVCEGLFLEDLRTKLDGAIADRSTRRDSRLQGVLVEIRAVQLFDPACGCGNFLVVAYRELRALELRGVLALTEGRRDMFVTGSDLQSLLHVNVEQCHGIELLEWPCRIAEVAMWLADHQANQAAAEALGQYFVRLPLVQSPRLHHGSALRMDWAALVPPTDAVRVLGNPPFIGHQWRSADQMADMERVYGSSGRFRRLDYVAAWYSLAGRYIRGTRARCAFVSTNSITQGEQADTLWSDLRPLGLQIDFAHRTFPWTSEALDAAKVHVVIIGFSTGWEGPKALYDYEGATGTALRVDVPSISPYLVQGSMLTVSSRSEPRQGQPLLTKGSQPTDGGNLLMDDAGRASILAETPRLEPFIRPFVGGQELINGGWRWCLWLKDADPALLRGSALVRARLAEVRAAREQSPTESVRQFASRPTLFTQDRQPDRPYLAVAEVSSERRRYLPAAWLPADVIASNKLQIAPEATLFHFGIMVSAMHMAWVRVVSGRLKSDISYSPSVFHSFPLPEPLPPAGVEAVTRAAQAVLDVRARFLPPAGANTLADLYDPDTTPPALVKAHRTLDLAVERLYREKQPFESDRERVEHLFQLYERSQAPLLPPELKRKGRNKG